MCVCVVITQFHTTQVNTIAWNGTGTRLLSGSDDCHLKIYDAASGLVGQIEGLTKLVLFIELLIAIDVCNCVGTYIKCGACFEFLCLHVVCTCSST